MVQRLRPDTMSKLRKAIDTRVARLPRHVQIQLVRALEIEERSGLPQRKTGRQQ